ncbi:hypothetical protein LTR36_009913 [Oleoguttula mirabilis]|uniref:Myb-like DNA-binding domain-containing protein n=1 Tax=Oleoguttula mirabilis TaxID=1507867 RepID=A0AAV9J5Q2_9PEZI|nr:hypothetical protein LTR36_009913 [Oleoguttula mirabilis]
MADVTDEKKKDITDEKFFFAIIKQLDGSIDWQKVADEAGIVSKGAASKRFSRMKLKFEKGSGGEGGSSPAKATTPAGDGEEKSTKPAKTKPAKKGGNKKRKIEQASEEEAEKPVKDEEEEV